MGIAMRNLLNPHQKFQIALAALKGDKTVAELSSTFAVHPSKIEEWKALLLQGAPALFNGTERRQEQSRIEKLQKIIGERQEEIDWLKKKLPHALPSEKNLTH